jgi:hypothetical protein
MTDDTDFNLQEQIARIDRDNAEMLKLVAEARKRDAEVRKLEAEARQEQQRQGDWRYTRWLVAMFAGAFVAGGMVTAIIIRAFRGN